MVQHLKSAIILHTFAGMVLQGVYVDAFGRSVWAGGLRGGFCTLRRSPFQAQLKDFRVFWDLANSGRQLDVSEDQSFFLLVTGLQGIETLSMWHFRVFGTLMSCRNVSVFCQRASACSWQHLLLLIRARATPIRFWQYSPMSVRAVSATICYSAGHQCV